MLDRRIFERIPVSRTVYLLNLAINRWMKAATCDLSAKGVGIVSKEYFLRDGDDLELWISMPYKGVPHYTRGRVTWTNTQGPDYKSGICLERAELMGMSRVSRM